MAKVIYEGTEMTVGEAVRASGSHVCVQTVRARLKLGWPLLRALSLPKHEKKWDCESVMPTVKS